MEKEREGRRRKKGRGEGHSTDTYNVHTCYHEYTTVPFRELSGGLVKVFADGDCSSSLCVTQLDILEKSVGHKLCVCVCECGYVVCVSVCVCVESVGVLCV